MLSHLQNRSTIAIERCRTSKETAQWGVGKMSTGVTYQYLERRPRSAYRQLFVKNTRIRAELIYRAHVNVEEPMSAEELASDYMLPLAAILEAIEYGKSNPPEIAADSAREEALMAATGQLDPTYKYRPRPKLLTAEEWARLRS
jgi:uncharacterized protein (DUF433 family)